MLTVLFPPSFYAFVMATSNHAETVVLNCVWLYQRFGCSSEGDGPNGWKVETLINNGLVSETDNNYLLNPIATIIIHCPFSLSSLYISVVAPSLLELWVVSCASLYMKSIVYHWLHVSLVSHPCSSKSPHILYTKDSPDVCCYGYPTATNGTWFPPDPRPADISHPPMQSHMCTHCTLVGCGRGKDCLSGRRCIHAQSCNEDSW